MTALLKEKQTTEACLNQLLERKERNAAAIPGGKSQWKKASLTYSQNTYFLGSSL